MGRAQHRIQLWALLSAVLKLRVTLPNNLNSLVTDLVYCLILRTFNEVVPTKCQMTWQFVYE
jgi:hypothetical protein